ncbi:MAG TPA: hypothetical protein PKC19_09870 [Roseiflexaceae bacterium]|nr:hypothetical protein [Roseiflexaceae bacterium]
MEKEPIYIDADGPCICGGRDIDFTDDAEPAIRKTAFGWVEYLVCFACGRTYRRWVNDGSDADDLIYHSLELMVNPTTPAP